jgi:hypothetical protein
MELEDVKEVEGAEEMKEKSVRILQVDAGDFPFRFFLKILYVLRFFCSESQTYDH